MDADNTHCKLIKINFYEFWLQVPTVVYILDSLELVPTTAANKVQRTAVLGVLNEAGIDPIIQVSKVSELYAAL